MKKHLIIAPFLAVSSTFAFAEDSNYIRLGGFMPLSQEGAIQLREKGIGATLDLDEALDLKAETQVFRLDGFYRFNKSHRIEYTYYSLKSDGNSRSDQTITIGDDEISAGSTISSKLDLDILKANYTYSFYHSDEVELGLSGGLHVTSMDTSLEFEGNVNGSPSSRAEAKAVITAPLPVVGWRFHYNILDELKLSMTYDLFAISIGGFKGSYTDSQILLDYQVYKKLGIGFGYNRTAYNLNAEDGDTTLKLNRSLGGLMLFGSYRF